jgi:DNA polymerase-1
VTEIGYQSETPLTHESKAVLRAALDEVYDEVVLFKKGDDIGFGVDVPGVRTLSPEQMKTYPFPERYVTQALHRVNGAWPELPAKTLFLDIETHNAGKEYSMPTEEFFRLGQYAWGWHGPIVLTPSYAEIITVMRQADLIIAHNGHPFDFSVLLGDDALEWARDGRLFDTFVFANLVLPAPAKFVMRDGTKVATVNHKGQAMVGGVKRWLSLDNLSYQLNLTGKMGDLSTIAKKYNPPKTLKRNLDYGLIPLDDGDFRIYAAQDIDSLRGVTRGLLLAHAVDAYDKREQLSAAINAQMTRNGFRVDVEKATARVQQLAERKAGLMQRLVEQYNFPTEGTMPWRSNPGKEAIFKILADAGITIQSHPDWTRTDTGNLSLSGDTLIELTTGTEAEELGEALAELQGQRPLAQQALDNLHPDGRVHHQIAALQRSGRSSTTEPSLTTWSAHGPKAVEKEYFIASEGRMLMEFDLSNADQRIVAALSGDQEYAKRFLPGVDGHEINGRIMFGDAVYDSDPAYYRNESKAPGHAWTYGAGAKKLAWTTGLPIETLYRFVDGMADLYVTLTDWQLEIRRQAEVDGFTVNRWGRKMVVDRDRSWTQTPALHGQSGTTEVLKDGLIRMLERDIRLIYWMVGTVHDAVVADIPVEELDWAPDAIVECLETEINGIALPVEHGEPASDWFAAGH